MARLPRYFVPGQPQHIILRGNNRQAIFAADQDYRFFRDCPVEAAQRFGLGVHAYVSMTHHVHLLATPNDVASLPITLTVRRPALCPVLQCHLRALGHAMGRALPSNGHR